MTQLMTIYFMPDSRQHYSWWHSLMHNSCTRKRGVTLWMVVHWNQNWNLRMWPNVSSKPLSRDLFYNMHSIIIIVYGVGPLVAWAPCYMKILTLIQSSKAAFTFYCKIYWILTSSKSNTFYCTCYLLYMVYELVSKLARDESIWRNLGRVLHIANMDTNELTSHCMGKTQHKPN